MEHQFDKWVKEYLLNKHSMVLTRMCFLPNKTKQNKNNHWHLPGWWISSLFYTDFIWLESWAFQNQSWFWFGFASCPSLSSFKSLTESSVIAQNNISGALHIIRSRKVFPFWECKFLNNAFILFTCQDHQVLLKTKVYYQIKSQSLHFPNEIPLSSPQHINFPYYLIHTQEVNSSCHISK